MFNRKEKSKIQSNTIKTFFATQIDRSPTSYAISASAITNYWISWENIILTTMSVAGHRVWSFFEVGFGCDLCALIESIIENEKTNHRTEPTITFDLGRKIQDISISKQVEMVWDVCKYMWWCGAIKHFTSCMFSFIVLFDRLWYVLWQLATGY